MDFEEHQEAIAVLEKAEAELKALGYDVIFEKDLSLYQISTGLILDSSMKFFASKKKNT
jgi:hypothetical protein